MTINRKTIVACLICSSLATTIAIAVADRPSTPTQATYASAAEAIDWTEFGRTHGADAETIAALATIADRAGRGEPVAPRTAHEISPMRAWRDRLPDRLRDEYALAIIDTMDRDGQVAPAHEMIVAAAAWNMAADPAVRRLAVTRWRIAAGRHHAQWVELTLRMRIAAPGRPIPAYEAAALVSWENALSGASGDFPGK